MKRPDPRDFGFKSSSDASRPLKEDAGTGRFGCIMVVAYYIGLISLTFAFQDWFSDWLLPQSDWIQVAFGLVVWTPYGLPVVVWYLSCFLYALTIPNLKQAKAFQTAMEEYENWWVRTQEEFWFSLNGRQFELELAQLFRDKGYDVTLTPGSGDRGVDIYLRKGGMLTVVQAKAHKRPLGPAVMRELYGTMVAESADSAILASLAGATRGAMDFAGGKGIRVLTVSDLIAMKTGRPTAGGGRR